MNEIFVRKLDGLIIVFLLCILFDEGKNNLKYTKNKFKNDDLTFPLNKKYKKIITYLHIIEISIFFLFQYL